MSPEEKINSLLERAAKDFETAAHKFDSKRSELLELREMVNALRESRGQILR